jgi:hypothetical protein
MREIRENYCKCCQPEWDVNNQGYWEKKTNDGPREMANEEEQTQLEEFRCREQMDNPLGHPTNIMGWRIGTLFGID